MYSLYMKFYILITECILSLYEVLYLGSKMYSLYMNIYTLVPKCILFI